MTKRRPGQADPWAGVSLWDRLTLRVSHDEQGRYYEYRDWAGFVPLAILALGPLMLLLAWLGILPTR
ncbi:MAG: hypothetical protein GEU80_07090 [Dehalococcoidia bacterium]|nr:hypothetical protein [Dehalococcoidia bacterium]